MVSVPYAFQAQNAETLDGLNSTDFMPSSAVVQQLIRDFVVASGESVSVGDVISFLDGHVQKGLVPWGFGSAQAFHSPAGEDGRIQWVSAAALSSTKFVVSYQDMGNSWYGTAIIGEVTGTTITYSSEYVFNFASTQDISTVALSSTEFVVAYKDYANSDYGTAIIGGRLQVEGNSLLVGVQVEKEAALLRVGMVSVEGTQPPRTVSLAGLLDLDDLRPVVGEELRAVRAGHVVGEVQHLEVGERLLHGCPLVTRLVDRRQAARPLHARGLASIVPDCAHGVKGLCSSSTSVTDRTNGDKAGKQE